MSESQPILFIGESNPYGDDPSFALYDEPEGASGHRLRTILGLSRDVYLGPQIERVNLCKGKFSLKSARRAATTIAVRARDYKAVICLGAKVRNAFGFSDIQFFDLLRLESAIFACLPHPSGRNLIWSDPASTNKARALMAEVGLAQV